TAQGDPLLHDDVGRAGRGRGHRRAARRQDAGALVAGVPGRVVEMAKFPMTPRGQQALRDELKRLREVERPKNVRDIEEARAHGDLKENAEYHAAKERQSFIEGRSRDIESILAQGEVIDPAKLSGTKVVFGATVRLSDIDNGEEVTYTVVGDHEADIKLGKI